MNTDPTDFEKRLSAVTLRPVPGEWKAGILAAAGRASLTPSNQEDKRDPRQRVTSFFYSLLWPHPRAWAALACLWVVIAVLNLSGPKGDALLANTDPLPQRTAEALLADLEHVISRNRLLVWEENVIPDNSKL